MGFLKDILVTAENNSGFGPEFEEIKRCIEMILSVRAGEQPMDRDFGIDIEGIVGYPMNVARNMLSLEIIEKIKRYEPRVRVVSVQIEFGADGQIIPHVRCARAEV